MISHKSVAFDYPTPSRMPLPQPTFSKIAPTMDKADALVISDMDDTLGISEKGNYGTFKNKREIDLLERFLKQDDNHFWVMGNTTSPAGRMGIWENHLTTFPMQQLVLEKGTAVYDNPHSPDFNAGSWLKTIGGGDTSTLDKAWQNTMVKDYAWDPLKIKYALVDYLTRQSQPITPARQAWTFHAPGKLASEDFREFSTEKNPLPFPFALDLPGHNFNNAVLSVPKNSTKLDEQKIEWTLKFWLNTFLNQYTANNKLTPQQRQALTPQVFPFQPTDKLYRFILGCQLKTVNKATYPQTLLSEGKLASKLIIPVGDADNDRSILFAEYKNQAGKPIPSYPILRVNELPNEHHAGNRQLIKDVAKHPNSVFIVPEEQTEAFKTTFPDIDSSTRVRPNYSLALSQQITAFKAAQKP